MDNRIEIRNKAYVCRNCRNYDITCNKCNASVKDDNFYLWLILTRLDGARDIIINYPSSLSSKATNIIELLKRSVGLNEVSRTTKKGMKTELNLKCKCGNDLKIRTEGGDEYKDYDCRKCRNKSFVIVDSNEVKVEETDVVLEKIPAVIAFTGG